MSWQIQFSFLLKYKWVEERSSSLEFWSRFGQTCSLRQSNSLFWFDQFLSDSWVFKVSLTLFDRLNSKIFNTLSILMSFLSKNILSFNCYIFDKNLLTKKKNSKQDFELTSIIPDSIFLWFLKTNNDCKLKNGRFLSRIASVAAIKLFH